MPQIDRYICSRLFSLFGFFALVLVSIYWINRAVLLFEDLLSDGQTALVVLEFTALTLPLVIATVLPVAGFAASAYGIQKLSGDSELVVMQSAGMSPWRLARPVAVFGLSVGLLVALLVHGLVPMARARLAERQAQISENVTARFLHPGTFQFPARGLTVFIGQISDDGRLLNMFIEDARNPADQSTYTAEEALLLKSENGPRLVMMRGMVQNLRRIGDQRRLSVTRFADFTYDIGNLIAASDPRGQDLRDYGTLRLLTPDAALLAATGASAAEARLEAHQRLAQPLLAPVAVLLGFAALMLGGYSRFGMWPQLTGAIVGLIVVNMLKNGAENLAALDPSRWGLVYVPALAGLAAVAVMLWWAARPRRPLRARIAQARGKRGAP
ncbi:LPS export ABC transporter permease LptF [Paracoccus sp. p1-h21]|uniref:LPS export ABC transporter permease LptF n=1 Tax=Paracoccus sp. p1-h21 TaxID=3366951 RepID=UPI0037A212F8